MVVLIEVISIISIISCYCVNFSQLKFLCFLSILFSFLLSCLHSLRSLGRHDKLISCSLHLWSLASINPSVDVLITKTNLNVTLSIYYFSFHLSRIV